ncbi:hypothetical protein NQ317_000240 [Molorchus minor]|uniref:Serpin domain-containing protein n=1 Tax=Molorchus minor TaxID=1323400 RepID=A0ABQ9JTM2_9CUCU|nr:hypothetical protein NQ317_000240 [Molorchus minor]
MDESISNIINGISSTSRSIVSNASKLKKNFIFSPISLHELLGLMAHDPGVKQEAFTRTSILSDIDDVVMYYKDVLNWINSTGNETLSIKNKAFPAETFEFRELFRRLLVKNYLFELNPADSSGDLLVNKINTWVEETTNKKIANFIEANTLENSLRLALLNDVNFDGKWAEPFNSAKTAPGTFYLNDNETVQVEMMKTKREVYYKYLEYNNVQILQLPFVNDDISLFAVLQDKNVDVTEGAGWDNFFYYLDDLEKEEVNISLPKFKIEVADDYMNILKEMGLKEELENSNLFGVFNNDEWLNFSRIYEKGFIDINEEGSQIASGTIFTFVPSNADEKCIIP